MHGHTKEKVETWGRLRPSENCAEELSQPPQERTEGKKKVAWDGQRGKGLDASDLTTKGKSSPLYSFGGGRKRAAGMVGNAKERGKEIHWVLGSGARMCHCQRL